MATLPRFSPRPEPEWRPLAPTDIAYVAALEAQIHAVPWTPGNFRDAITAGYLTEAGEREGRIVAYGVLLLAPGEAQILNLSVVPDARREGLGRTLLRRFVAHATRLGAEQVFLEVRVSNAAAVALYEARRIHLRRPPRRLLSRAPAERRAGGRARDAARARPRGAAARVSRRPS